MYIGIHFLKKALTLKFKHYGIVDKKIYTIVNT